MYVCHVTARCIVWCLSLYHIYSIYISYSATSKNCTPRLFVIYTPCIFFQHPQGHRAGQRLGFPDVLRCCRLVRDTADSVGGQSRRRCKWQLLGDQPLLQTRELQVCVLLRCGVFYPIYTDKSCGNDGHSVLSWLSQSRRESTTFVEIVVRPPATYI